jgi:hypothetical protein
VTTEVAAVVEVVRVIMRVVASATTAAFNTTEILHAFVEA